jgi:heptosyltransferase-2
MGDLLMSLPAIHSIRRAMPETEIHLLARIELHPLLEGHPDLNKLHPFEMGHDRGWRRLPRTSAWLRREGFDAVIVMNPSKFFHAASFLAGIPLRIGYRRKLGFLLTRSLPDTKGERDLHETEYNLELVRLLGVTAHEESLSLPARPEPERKARELLERSGVPAGTRPVAIHPWTSNPAKNLPPELFWEATTHLIRQGQTVLLIGQADGEETAAVPPGVVNLAGRTPLDLLPCVLRRCRLLVSNDSGPVHVAAAVGTPTIVVAPQSHAAQLRRWRPVGAAHQILIDPNAGEVVRACGS